MKYQNDSKKLPNPNFMVQLRKHAEIRRAKTYNPTPNSQDLTFSSSEESNEIAAKNKTLSNLDLSLRNTTGQKQTLIERNFILLKKHQFLQNEYQIDRQRRNKKLTKRNSLACKSGRLNRKRPHNSLSDDNLNKNELTGRSKLSKSSKLSISATSLTLTNHTESKHQLHQQVQNPNQAPDQPVFNNFNAEVGKLLAKQDALELAKEKENNTHVPIEKREVSYSTKKALNTDESDHSSDFKAIMQEENSEDKTNSGYRNDPDSCSGKDENSVLKQTKQQQHQTKTKKLSKKRKNSVSKSNGNKNAEEQHESDTSSNSFDFFIPKPSDKTQIGFVNHKPEPIWPTLEVLQQAGYCRFPRPNIRHIVHSLPNKLRSISSRIRRQQMQCLDTSLNQNQHLRILTKVQNDIEKRIRIEKRAREARKQGKSDCFLDELNHVLNQQYKSYANCLQESNLINKKSSKTSRSKSQSNVQSQNTTNYNNLINLYNNQNQPQKSKSSEMKSLSNILAQDNSDQAFLNYWLNNGNFIANNTQNKPSTSKVSMTPQKTVEEMALEAALAAAKEQQQQQSNKMSQLQNLTNSLTGTNSTNNINISNSNTQTNQSTHISINTNQLTVQQIQQLAQLQKLQQQQRGSNFQNTIQLNNNQVTIPISLFTQLTSQSANNSAMAAARASAQAQQALAVAQQAAQQAAAQMQAQTAQALLINQNNKSNNIAQLWSDPVATSNYYQNALLQSFTGMDTNNLTLEQQALLLLQANDLNRTKTKPASNNSTNLNNDTAFQQIANDPNLASIIHNSQLKSLQDKISAQLNSDSVVNQKTLTEQAIQLLQLHKQQEEIESRAQKQATIAAAAAAAAAVAAAEKSKPSIQSIQNSFPIQLTPEQLQQVQQFVENGGDLQKLIQQTTQQQPKPTPKPAPVVQKPEENLLNQDIQHRLLGATYQRPTSPDNNLNTLANSSGLTTSRCSTSEIQKLFQQENSNLSLESCEGNLKSKKSDNSSKSIDKESNHDTTNNVYKTHSTVPADLLHSYNAKSKDSHQDFFQTQNHHNTTPTQINNSQPAHNSRPGINSNNSNHSSYKAASIKQTFNQQHNLMNNLDVEKLYSIVNYVRNDPGKLDAILAQLDTDTASVLLTLSLQVEKEEELRRQKEKMTSANQILNQVKNPNPTPAKSNLFSTTSNHNNEPTLFNPPNLTSNNTQISSGGQLSKDLLNHVSGLSNSQIKLSNTSNLVNNVNNVNNLMNSSYHQSVESNQPTSNEAVNPHLLLNNNKK